MVTLSDVARRAGVSISVVSRVLNGDTALRARPDTQERVRDAARDLAYQPNHAARALRMAHAGAIGLIVPDVNNAIFSEMLRGVETAADRAGLQVLLGRSERLQPGGNFLGRLLGEGRVDGFLVQRSDSVDSSDFEEIAERTMPLVLLNSRRSRRGSVVLDDAQGARIATEHLLGLGHRDIALIGGDVHSFTSRRRESGYRAALTAAGIRRRSAWTARHGYFPEDGRRSMHELFGHEAARPTAVIVANVNAAIGALLGARELGLRVPGAVSVIAIHDTWVGAFSSPPLTVVRMPLYELGKAGVEALRGRLGGARPSDLTITDPEPVLVHRASTAPPPDSLARSNRDVGRR